MKFQIFIKIFGVRGQKGKLLIVFKWFVQFGGSFCTVFGDLFGSGVERSRHGGDLTREPRDTKLQNFRGKIQMEI